MAPDFKPGVVLSESLQATMSITAAFQAVVGNTYTSDYINGWEQYFVGGVVQLAAAPGLLGEDLHLPRPPLPES